MITPDQFAITYTVKRIGTERFLTVRVTNKSTQRLSVIVKFRQVKADGATTNKSRIDVRNVDPGETMEQDAALAWLLDWKRTEVYEVGASDNVNAVLDADYVTMPASYIVTKSSCFVATACLGFDDPAVAYLRALRDNTMVRSALGRRMIAVYEYVGPAAAEWIARHPIARRIAARVIASLVRVLPRAWANAGRYGS